MKNIFKYAILLTSATTIVSPAFAQNAVEEPTEEPTNRAKTDSGMIIVTARKQNETALEVPASITILDADAMATKNITKANELTGIVP